MADEQGLYSPKERKYGQIYKPYPQNTGIATRIYAGILPDGNSSFSGEISSPSSMQKSDDPIKHQYCHRNSFLFPAPVDDLKGPIYSEPKFGSIQSKGLDSDSDVQSAKTPSRRNTQTRVLMFIVICVILAAGASAVAIILTSSPEKHRYYESRTKLSVDQNYTKDLGNKDSNSFRNFSRVFCLSVQYIFVSADSSYKNFYQGCIVDQLSEGSIVVEFRNIFSADSTTNIDDQGMKAILVPGLVNRSSFAVIADSVEVSISYIEGSSDPLKQDNMFVYNQQLSGQATTDSSSTRLTSSTPVTNMKTDERETTVNDFTTTDAMVTETTAQTSQTTEMTRTELTTSATVVTITGDSTTTTEAATFSSVEDGTSTSDTTGKTLLTDPSTSLESNSSTTVPTDTGTGIDLINTTTTNDSPVTTAETSLQSEQTEAMLTTTLVEETTIITTPEAMVTTVSMNTHSQRAPVGGIGSFVCTASYTNLSESVVKIKRQLNDSTIATINSSGIFITPGEENKFSAEVAQIGGDIETTFNITSITCGDEGTFVCCLEKDNATLQTPAFELCVYADPSDVELTVNPDFVESLARAGERYYHVCKGNIGYPSNTSYLGIRLRKSSGDDAFVYSEATTKESDKNTNNSNFQWTVKVSENETMYVGSDVITGTCTLTQQIKFLLEIDSSWNNGIIECFIQEWNDQQNVSVSKEINLIPGNYCIGGGNMKKYHPDGCNKWVSCLNDYPYGSSCSDPTLCYDIHNGRDYCENCDQVSCEPEPTTTPLPTTTQYSAAYVTCTDAEASINDASAFIKCNVTSEAFTTINITRMSQESSRKSQEVWVASVSFNGDVVINSDIDDVVTFDTTSNPKSLDVEVRNISCTDRGQYNFRILGAANYSLQSVDLHVKVPPGGVSQTVNADFVEEIARAGDRYNHICTGDIGYPTGRAYVGIRLTKSGGGEQFTYSEEATSPSDIDKSNPTLWTVSILATGTLYIAGDKISGTCTLTQEIKYLLQLDSSWDDGTMECFVHDRQSNTDTAVSANITLIPANYCDREADDVKKSHPAGCTKFVACSQNSPYGWECQKNLCFSREKRHCERCDQVTCGP